MTDHKAEWVMTLTKRRDSLRMAQHGPTAREADRDWVQIAKAEADALDAAIAALIAAPAASEATINFDPIDSKLIDAASEGEDWPTREMVKAGTLGGALTPNMACASFQAAWLARPAAQASEGEDGAVAWACPEDMKKSNFMALNANNPPGLRGRAYSVPLYTRPAAQVAATPKAGSREERMVVIERDAGGIPTVWCDPEIVDLVTALNRGGLATVASCSGHGERHGNIALKDGRELLIAADFATARRYDALLLAATPKHDEGRIAELEAEVERLRHWNESVSVCPKHTADIVSFDGCVLCALDDYDPPTAALATQPAARRVTDDPRVVELIAADREFDEATAQHRLSSATAEQIARLNAAVMRRRAALESFAQPAEGVAGG